VIKPAATVRRSHVGQSATEHPPPYFFLSYVHDSGDDDVSVREFYDKLTHDVRLISGQRTGQVGFCDVSLRAGDRWSDRLVENLSTAQVFVAIVSPTYVTSEACGKEWTVFTRRMGGNRSSLLPLFWIPMAHPPAVVLPYQFRDAAFGTAYAQNGLRALIQRTAHRDDLRAFVEALAHRIVDLYRTVRVPPATGRPAFDEVDAAFGASVPAQRPGPNRANHQPPVSHRKPQLGMPRLNPADPWPEERR
jgi:hypothetical protein